MGENLKFHITIKDNETGRVVYDADTDIFICAFNGKNKIENAMMAVGSIVDLANTLAVTELEIKKCYEAKLGLKQLTEAIKTMHILNN